MSTKSLTFLPIIGLFLSSCQKEINPAILSRMDSTSRIDSAPPPPPPIQQKNYYVSAVYDLSDAAVARYFTYDSNNRIIKINAPYNMVNSRTFQYRADGLLWIVDYTYTPGWSPRYYGRDSLIYNSDKQIVLNYHKYNGYDVVVDTIKYNSMGLISTIVEGGGIQDFEYDKDSNLVYFKSDHETVTFGKYDSLPNPFHNLVSKYYFMEGLYDYSEQRLAGEEYAQLSKNNPGIVTHYDYSGYPDKYSTLKYQYDPTSKRPIFISDQQGGRDQIKYVQR